ncbi:Protein kinase domain [Trinorchestia longiramus]|nr:Protein kinase domain [Trinorchestia longiramus]
MCHDQLMHPTFCVASSDMLCATTDDHLGSSNSAAVGSFQASFRRRILSSEVTPAQPHPSSQARPTQEALASAVGALTCSPSMPLARAKSLLATLNPDSSVITDTSLSNTSLNANSTASQNFLFDTSVSVASTTGGGGGGGGVIGSASGGSGGSGGGFGGVGVGAGDGSVSNPGEAFLPPRYKMPIIIGPAPSSQFKQLFGEDDNNSNAEQLQQKLLQQHLQLQQQQQNGTTNTSNNRPNDTSTPVLRPSSGDSGNSIKNDGIRQPKTYVATPDQVMKYYMNKLTPYEHKEIYTYSHIYFIGANAKKRPGIVDGNQAASSNYGYDDQQGSYIHIPHDHIQYRYEVLKVIGKGSFGQVLKAYDHKNHMHVALKIVRNEKRFHRQAQEEIRILEHLRKQDKDNTVNIIHMFDHFNFRSHTCITFELLSINLYELIKKNKFMGFSLQLVRKFAHSLLFCLDTLHKNKIIHCDLKPENVLLKHQGRSGIKLGRLVSESHHQLGGLVSESHHQLGRLVSESACERKDPGSNPVVDMVDAARYTAWDLDGVPYAPVHFKDFSGVGRTLGNRRTPKEAVLRDAQHLTAFEKQEILNYEKQGIYYVGKGANKLHVLEPTSSGAVLQSCDDKDGHLVIVQRDHIAYRYEVVGVVGKGSFCRMIKAIDHKYRKVCAIKIIRNDISLLPLIESEISILSHFLRLNLTEVAHVVRLLNNFEFRNHVCLVFEILHMSLYDNLKLNQFKAMKMADIQYIALQLLECLSVLYELQIIHTDLKPENILLTNPNTLQIKVN